MKRFLVLLIFISSLMVHAQGPPMGSESKPITSLRERVYGSKIGWDLGINLGSAHSLADIGGNRDQSRILFLDTQWKATGLNVGIFGRYRFNELFAFSTNLNYASIGGADSLSPISSSRYTRAYSFSNQLFEVTYNGEIYVPPYYLYLPVDIFAFVGFGLAFHNPEIIVPDPDIFQEAPYSNIQIIVPMGLGLSYTFPNNFRIGYKIGWRKTFTDHLDALSTSMGSGNDSYYLNTFSLGYYFKQ